MTVAEHTSYQLDGLPDRATFMESALAVLARLIPAEAICWNSVDQGGDKVELNGSPPEVYNDPILARRMQQFSGDHPLVLSYLTETPAQLPSPRRLSDVSTRTELQRTVAYNEVLKPLGIEHQLTVLTARPSVTSGRCWAFVRTGRDYSDAESAIAREIQPMLQALDFAYRDNPAAVTDSVTARFNLSDREIQVLQHLARGLTAVAIGRLLRISPATVRKHLQHLYDKLEVHDRLQAVSLARTQGLIIG